MFGADTVDVSFAAELDVMARLLYINTIEEFDRPLSFDGNGQFFINHVKQDIANALVGCSTTKVINLTKEENPFTLNHAVVKAWFMNSWDKAKIFQDVINVILSEAW